MPARGVALRSLLWTMWGRLYNTAALTMWDNRLYFGEQELVEIEPGFFFSYGGEVLDLRGKVPTWRNIALAKEANKAR